MANKFTYRFAARNGDLTSTAFRIWVCGRDVYLGIRSIVEKHKVSLHRDGNCFISISRPYFDRLKAEHSELIAENAPKIQDVWVRPVPVTAPALIFRLILPISGFSKNTYDAKINEYEISNGNVGEFGVWILPKKVDANETSQVQICFRHSLQGDEDLMLTFLELPEVPRNILEALSRPINIPKNLHDAFQRVNTNTRIFIHGYDYSPPINTRWMIETALPSPPTLKL